MRCFLLRFIIKTYLNMHDGNSRSQQNTKKKIINSRSSLYKTRISYYNQRNIYQTLNNT